MAKANYKFDKRQRELKKSKSQAEKREKKLLRSGAAAPPEPSPPAKLEQS